MNHRTFLEVLDDRDDDEVRSGNPGHYGKLSTRILLLGHIHYAYFDRSKMLTRSTGVANTCRNLMVTLRRVDWSAWRERERAQNPKRPSFSGVISTYYSSATTEEEKRIFQIIVCSKSLRGSPRIYSRELAIIDLTTISRRGETSRFSRSEFFFCFFVFWV
jgi:hypothetical protein